MFLSFVTIAFLVLILFGKRIREKMALPSEWYQWRKPQKAASNKAFWFEVHYGEEMRKRFNKGKKSPTEKKLEKRTTHT